MAGKKVSTIASTNSYDENQPNKPAYKEILSLGFTDLLKIGLTENHIRSGGLILYSFCGFTKICKKQVWMWTNIRKKSLNGNGELMA